GAGLYTLAATSVALGCGGTGRGDLERDEDSFTTVPAHLHPTPDAGGGSDGGAPAMALPLPALTPGAVLTSDLHKICQPGYPSTVRNVTAQEKAAVAAAYHYTGPSSAVEYDHLISLELGGSNDQTNLWPQPIDEAHLKDRLEGYLHEHVCHGD